jgi:hypothetical protein
MRKILVDRLVVLFYVGCMIPTQGAHDSSLLVVAYKTFLNKIADSTDGYNHKYEANLFIRE